MRIAIEESGNFGFPDNGRFEPYVLVALIAPESEMPSIAAVADFIRARTGHDEIKANKLGARGLAFMAGRVAQLPLRAVVYALDSEMMSRSFIAEFRMEQAARVAHARDELLQRGEPLRAGLLEEVDELIRVVGLVGEPGAMSHAEFAQYQAVPDLMVAAINEAVAAFQDASWDDDLRHLSFVLDRKLPDRLNAGERYVDQQGMRIIGSNSRFSVSLPEIWRDRPDHPFRRAFEPAEEGYLSVNKMLADCRHVDSRSDDLLQLADFVGGIVRRAILDPDREAKPLVHQALDEIRPILDNGRGDLVRIFRLRGANAPEPERYRAVIAPPITTTPAPARGPGGAVLLG